MDTGFDNLKDILDVVVIPVTLAVLAILFPAIKSWYIRRRFKKLIVRELQEITPFPETATEGGRWHEHVKKRCIHREIFEKPTENRDFILSLPPDLVYYLSNLWDNDNFNDPAGKQWKNYIGELNRYFKDTKLGNVQSKWLTLLDEYESRGQSENQKADV